MEKFPYKRQRKMFCRYLLRKGVNGGDTKNMDVEYLKMDSDLFDDIVEEIKQKNLSKNSMPKIVEEDLGEVL